MVGEDAAVEHVGIGDDDAFALADLAAFVLGGVAIVAVYLNREFAGVDEAGGFGRLVVGEGFGGKEVEGAGRRPF